VDRLLPRRRTAGTGAAQGRARALGGGGGLRSLVADLLDGLDVQQDATVASVGPGPVVDGRAYDAVVLAMPDPQAERLLDPALEAERAAVAGRAWEPVLAVAAGWDERSWAPDFDGCFVDGSEQLGWIADDGRRRGDGAAVLVGHSTSPYAADRLADPQAATGDLVDAVRRVLHVDAAPAWTRVQRWTFARPAAPRTPPSPRTGTGRPVRRRLGLAARRDGVDLRATRSARAVRAAAVTRAGQPRRCACSVLVRPPAGC
jgi:hypothetical protein